MKSGKYLYLITPQHRISDQLFVMCGHDDKILNSWDYLKNQMRYNLFYSWEHWIQERIKHEIRYQPIQFLRRELKHELTTQRNR